MDESVIVRKLTDIRAGKKADAYWPVSRGRAAVLIPLIPVYPGPEEDTKEDHGGKGRGPGEEVHYDVLFEIRSRNIAQGGEICFPGGGIEGDETPEECAERETEEELLLSKDRIRILTPLCSIFGPAGRRVTSVLGVLHGYEGTYEKDEVSGVFRLPLSYFLKERPQMYYGAMAAKLPADFPYELIPGGKSYQWKDVPRTFYFYVTEYGTIWGMTAELCWLFSESLREACEEEGRSAD